MKTTTYILLYLLIAANLNAQFSANFTADSTVGCAPLCVHFQNLSLPDSNVSFFWDLGNGTFSSLKNPETVYLEAGQYTVTLILSSDLGNDTIIKQNFINVLGAPQANIIINQDSIGCLPYPVNFYDASTGENITYRIWDFGDGVCSHDTNPQHLYTNVGDFSVKLYVADENGCSDEIELNNFIKVRKPSANFNVIGNTVTCDAQQTISFENLSSGENLSYFWNFGNGSTSTSENPEITYSESGNFDVTLITTDIYGCSDTAIKQNLIQNMQVKAMFRQIQRVNCPNDDIIFDNVSKNATYYKWDFDDGSDVSFDFEPSHKYLEGGNYYVKLIASNDYGCADTFTSRVNVEKIKAYFELDKNFICQLPDTVHYINKSDYGTRYEWHFGNGQISTEENPSIAITRSGYWSDTLYAYSLHGCIDKYVSDSALHVATPRAYFTPNNWVDPFSIMGCVPLTVDFSDGSSYEATEDSIISWQWTFDDGTSSAEQNPQHTFASLDTFTVRLKIKTAQGCESEYIAWAKTGTRQFADFTADHAFDTICASTGVQFYNLSQTDSLINTSYWLFGDSTYSTQREPMHFFTDTGWMDVKLLVYNNGCPDDTLIENFVYIKAPYHEFNYEVNCDNPYEVQFSADLTDVDKFYWDFGDNSAIDSVNINPVHIFPHRGWFTVTLHSEKNGSCCDYTSTENILIVSPEANFSVIDTNLCVGETILLDAANSIDAAVFYAGGQNCLYQWKFDDTNENFYKIDSLIYHTFDKEGDFNVTLTIRGNNKCFDSFSRTFHVHKPTCDFTTSEISGCVPLNVNFTNTTNSYFGIDSVFWAFGDNTFSNDTNPTHTYTSNGNFDITLFVQDTLGCRDTLTAKNYLQLLHPVPNFSANKQNVCSNEEINFSFIHQQDTIITILWDFGDGTTSTEASPTHIYTDSGHYSVSLYLQDANGCDSIKTIENYIYVQNTPIANFYADTTQSDCYPLVVHFYDNSQNSDNATYKWTLGTNVVSYQKNPAYSYTKPGKYSVSLQVTTSNGCSTQITKPDFINVGGPYAEIVADDTICKFAPAQFSITNARNINYLQWFFDDGAASSDSISWHSYANPGNYRIILLLNNDSTHFCQKYFTTNLFVRDIKAGFEIDSITNACVPFEFYLKDTTQNTNHRQWLINDNIIDSALNFYNICENPGEYEITLFETDKYGCKDTSTQKITVNQLPQISVLQDTFICSGDKITLWAKGADEYIWSPAEFLSGSNSDSPVAAPDYSTLFSVTGIDTNGCVNYASTFVKVVQQPDFFIDDTAIIVGDTIVLDNYSDDIGSYLWTPSDGLSCSDCPNPQISPLNSTSYTLTITDTAGCFTLTKNIFIDVYQKYSLDVPSAFTPNNDGINDIIRPDGWGIEELIYFRIFNRFGELVFETNNLYEGWDGTYKGRPQPVETYRYSVAVKSYDGKIRTKQGTIKLIH